jgi:ABC-type antimicrobial peptide transport system ATPase subunit
MVTGFYEKVHNWRLKKRGTRFVPSEHQTPIDPDEISSQLMRIGFRVVQRRFWTNIGWKRRSRLKKLLIRMLVSDTKGNACDFWFERMIAGGDQGARLHEKCSP